MSAAISASPAAASRSARTLDDRSVAAVSCAAAMRDSALRVRRSRSPRSGRGARERQQSEPNTVPSGRRSGTPAYARMPVARTNGCAAAAGSSRRVADERGRLPGDHGVTPGELARDPGAGRDGAERGGVPVHVVHDEGVVAQLGDVGELHPEQLTGGRQQPMPPPRIGRLRARGTVAPHASQRSRQRPSSAAARPRVGVAVVLAPALEVAPRHHRLARVLAPRVLDVAVVGASRPTTSRRYQRTPERRATVMAALTRARRSRAKRPPSPAPASARRALLGRREQPGGATSCDSTAGTSVVGSGSRARMALTQIRAASSDHDDDQDREERGQDAVDGRVGHDRVHVVHRSWPAARTSPRSIASWNLSRWAKKPSFGSSEKTFC